MPGLNRTALINIKIQHKRCFQSNTVEKNINMLSEFEYGLGLRPRALFSPYEPPGWQITYMYLTLLYGCVSQGLGTTEFTSLIG